MKKDESKRLEISQRISRIKTYYCNNNNKEFAEKIGVTQQYSSNICNGSKSIGKNVLKKILDSFPEVSKLWLFSGKGPMLAGNDTASDGSALSATGDSSATDIQDLIHTVGQLSDTLHLQSDTINRQSLQISRLLDLLANNK